MVLGNRNVHLIKYMVIRSNAGLNIRLYQRGRDRNSMWVGYKGMVRPRMGLGDRSNLGLYTRLCHRGMVRGGMWVGERGMVRGGM